MDKGSKRVLITVLLFIFLVCLVSGKLFTLFLVFGGICLFSRLICNKSKPQTHTVKQEAVKPLPVYNVAGPVLQTDSDGGFNRLKPISITNMPGNLVNMKGRIISAIIRRHTCLAKNVDFVFAKEIGLIEHNDSIMDFRFEGLILPKVVWAYKKKFGLTDYYNGNMLDLRNVFEPLRNDREKAAFKIFLFNFQR